MSKKAVAYFSTGGVTAGVAKTLSRLSGADFCVLYKLRAWNSCTIPLCKMAGAVLYYSQKG